MTATQFPFPPPSPPTRKSVGMWGSVVYMYTCVIASLVGARHVKPDSQFGQLANTLTHKVSVYSLYVNIDTQSECLYSLIYVDIHTESVCLFSHIHGQ